MTIKKYSITFFTIVFVVFLFIAAMHAMIKVQDSQQKELDKFNSAVGKKVNIDGEVLTVVNASAFYRTYTLSNGLVISEKLVNNK